MNILRLAIEAKTSPTTKLSVTRKFTLSSICVTSKRKKKQKTPMFCSLVRGGGRGGYSLTESSDQIGPMFYYNCDLFTTEK